LVEPSDVSSLQAEFARLWRAMPKVVSKTLDSVGWNSRLQRGDVTGNGLVQPGTSAR
jgi:hypothetical protein